MRMELFFRRNDLRGGSFSHRSEKIKKRKIYRKSQKNRNNFKKIQKNFSEHNFFEKWNTIFSIHGYNYLHKIVDEKYPGKKIEIFWNFLLTQCGEGGILIKSPRERHKKLRMTKWLKGRWTLIITQLSNPERFQDFQRSIEQNRFAYEESMHACVRSRLKKQRCPARAGDRGKRSFTRLRNAKQFFRTV